MVNPFAQYKALLYGSFIGAVLLAFVGSNVYSYRLGYGNAEDKARKESLNVFVEAVRSTERVFSEVMSVGRKLAIALEHSRQREIRYVQKAADIIERNPGFASVLRPPELDSLRQDSLEAIRRASEASSLRRRSPEGVRTPDGGTSRASPRENRSD